MLGLPARTRGFSPVPFGRVPPLLAALAMLTLWVPQRCMASTAIVPDDYPLIQLGINSGADTILVRAGTYAENVLLVAVDRPIVLMADPDAAPRPTLQGLVVKANHDNEGDRTVVGLRVLSAVDIQSGSVSSRYDFEACVLEAGVGHLLGDPEYSHAGSATSFRSCTLRGNTNLIAGNLSMESDTVEAGGAYFRTGGDVHVSHCLFHDSQTGLEIEQVKGPLNAEIVESLFEDCETGIRVFGDWGWARIANNTVRACRGWGIRLDHVEYGQVIGNDVRQCGRGIEAKDGGLQVIGNAVIGGSYAGIALFGYRLQDEVRDNVVLRCGEQGIVIVQDDAYWTCSLTGNTSALNAGAGFYIAMNEDWGVTPACVVSNNIAFGNAAQGLFWNGPGPPTLSCNDWFGNTAGATWGFAPGATDLSVDPLFCDLANDDVRLRSDSPLLGGACGQIGARGVGCDGSTEVLVALFDAEASDEGVRIRWRLGGDEEPLSVWIERSAGELGPWVRVATERSMDGAVATDWDRTAEPGRRYWYRLAWTTADGSTTYSSPIVIDLASPASSLALRVIGPNPASGPVVIEYVLPRGTAIDLTVHDLLGREVARLASGAQSQGLHVTQWTGNAGSRRAPPGLYFVRLGSPDGQQSRRILLRQ